MFRRSWGHIGSDGVWGRMESTQHVLKDTDITEMDTTDATVDAEETMSQSHVARYPSASRDARKMGCCNKSLDF